MSDDDDVTLLSGSGSDDSSDDSDDTAPDADQTHHAGNLACRTLLKSEVNLWQSLGDDNPGHDAFRSGDRFKCPMCPLKTFASFQHVPAHIDKYHKKPAHGTVLTKSVLRMAEAKFNFNQVRSRIKLLTHPGVVDQGQVKYLHECAELLAIQLRRSPSWETQEPRMHKVTAKFDRRIVLLLDNDETRFIFKADVGRYHRISDRYMCSDRFLSAFLGALIHPETKGAKKRVDAMLKDRFGWLGYLLPRNPVIFKTLCEKLSCHHVLLAMKGMCRNTADKRIAGIDATYSVLLSVLHQTPHGKVKHNECVDQGPNLHAILTVQCLQSVLAVWPASSEAFENQLDALRHGLGDGGLNDLLLLFSDNPETADDDKLYDEAQNLECCAMDDIHPALKIEQVSGERVTKLSALYRRCLKKFNKPADDGRPYYKKGMRPITAPSLDDVVQATTNGAADKRLKAIQADTYPLEPYASALDHLTDVAALVVLFPEEMHRKKPGRGNPTILKSLRHSTRPVLLEYLMNASRFGARNPDIPMMTGTRRNEAYHQQLKSMFRNVMFQTGRNARVVADIATLVKLLAGFVQRECPLTIQHREHELLRHVATSLMDDPLKFEPLMDHRVVKDPVLIASALPPNAKTMRKRPASASKRPAPLSKRPASLPNRPAPVSKRPASASKGTPAASKRPASHSKRRA
jgi:hypothetical protein